MKKRFDKPPTLRHGGALPAHFPNKVWGNGHKTLNDASVRAFLGYHPEVLEDFMYESVDIEVLEELLSLKKNRKLSCLKSDKAKSKFKPKKHGIETEKEAGPFESTSLKEVAANISRNILVESNCQKMIECTSKVIQQGIKADTCNVYISKMEGKTFSQLREGRLTKVELTGIPNEAFTKKSAVVVNGPRTRPTENGEDTAVDVNVLCVPMVMPSGRRHIKTILEFSRNNPKPHFTEIDVQLVNAFLGWIAVCISERNQRKRLTTTQQLMDYLLENTRDLFDGTVQMDALVPKIMRYTKDLVDADRCSMFLLDETTDELYADFFDEGAMSDTGMPIFKKKEQIRFPKSKGIAGMVAEKGVVVNIQEAYEDARFNPAIDKLTGYTTRNILCMPVLQKSKVIGVIQMINCMKADYFTEADENALRMFAIYCAMAIHYNSFYNSIETHQNKYKVCLELLDYHIQIHKDECRPYLDCPFIGTDAIPRNFETFSFCSSSHPNLLPHLFCHMVTDLFGKTKFDIEKLVKFTLTVRKNYRQVPYHHWEHGFNVAHTLWLTVRNTSVFKEYEKMALLFAGLCHDIDHRGYNNSFFTKLNLPLGSLYSTSVMEQHHYRQTVMILQTEGQNIFSFMRPTEYKELLEDIRCCIIATDLSLHFQNFEDINAAIDEKRFDFDDVTMRRHTLDILMSGADLCGMAKPWKSQKISVSNLYEEFYEQGDEEKNRGLVVESYMDREKSAEIPQQQVEFYNYVCIPLYTTLLSIFPHTKPLREMAIRNRNKWQDKVFQQEKFEDTSNNEDDEEDDEIEHCAIVDPSDGGKELKTIVHFK